MRYCAVEAGLNASRVAEPTTRTTSTPRPGNRDTYRPPGPLYEQVQGLYQAQSDITRVCHELMDGGAHPRAPCPGPRRSRGLC